MVEVYTQGGGVIGSAALPDNLATAPLRNTSRMEIRGAAHRLHVVCFPDTPQSVRCLINQSVPCSTACLTFGFFSTGSSWPTPST